MAQHKNIVGDAAIHEIMYVQSSDPGAVGAKKFWLDTTGAATLDAGAILKQRNGSDTGWTTRADIKTALDLKASTTYVDAALAGLSWKQSVRVATTTAGTLASSFENGDTIDGVTLATGDRILIKDQSTGSENGIYVVAASGAPTRATDADSAAEIRQASMYVEEGTTNADTQWVCTTNAPITLGSTSLTFAQLSSGGSVTDATISTSDITTNNTSTSKHGWAPKLPNDATKFLDGTGAWTTPSTGVTAVSAQYWRLLGSESGLTSNYVAYSAMAFKDTGGSSIATSGGSVIESGHLSTFAASNLFDGTNSTFWEAPSNQLPWAGYHFASSVAVGQIGLQKAGSMDGSFPGPVAIVQCSQDGAVWQSIAFISPSDGLTANDTMVWFTVQ
jgi:hypothetical protein